MEMLIVVAIIAILAAIAIPIFSAQISNTRLAADAANLRTAETLAISDAMVNAHIDDMSTTSTLTIAQTPKEEAAETQITQDNIVYHFNYDASGTGIEIAEASGALAATGNFESSYDSAYTIVVCVSPEGELLAAGWEEIPTTGNGG